MHDHSLKINFVMIPFFFILNKDICLTFVTVAQSHSFIFELQHTNIELENLGPETVALLDTSFDYQLSWSHGILSSSNHQHRASLAARTAAAAAALSQKKTRQRCAERKVQHFRRGKRPRDGQRPDQRNDDDAAPERRRRNYRGPRRSCSSPNFRITN